MHRLSAVLFLLLRYLTIQSCQAFGTFIAKGSIYQLSSASRTAGGPTLLRVYGETMTPLSNDEEAGFAGNKAAEESDQFRIGYLSDVEGHWDYFL